MTIKQKFSSIDQSKLTADQKSFLDKIKNVTKDFTDAEMNKKVEQPLDNFIAKAKEKMPEAIKSAPVKRTSTKANPSQTRKPKRTPMSLAKEIRKEGESWSDARARASKMMKEDSKDLSKTVETELDKLTKLVRSQKDKDKLAGISGTDIKRDSVRKAKPRGTRTVTHSGETSNQYGTFNNKLGRKYTENRDRHSDRLAPNYPKNAPLLAEGGDIDAFTLRMVKSNGMQPAEVLKEDANVKYAGGGLFSTGRPKSALMRDRKNVNHSEDYEVRYSKPILRRTGYKGNRKLELGGGVMVTDLAGHTGGGTGGLNAGMPLSGVSGTAYTGLVGETGAMSSGEMFMAGGSVNSKRMGDYVGKHFIWRNHIYYIVAFKKYVNRVANPYNRDKKTTGSLKGSHFEPHFTVFEIKLKESMPIDDPNQRLVGFSVKHWEVDDMFDYINNKRKIKISNEKLPSKVQEFLNSKKELIYIHKKAKYELGGGLPSGVSQSYIVTEAFGNPAQHFNKGGSITNERKHVNHNEDYEVRYAKPRPQRTGYKGVRGFATGGGLDEKEFSLAQAIDFIKEAKKDRMTFYYNVYGGNDYFTLQPTFATPTGKLKGYPSKVTITKEGNITGRNLTYNDGGALTNERKHVNHNEDYEVRYAKPRPSRKGYKGARKFMAGGMNDETPRIYVADLEAYNNGRLVGEWLDLADYDDADELMEAIQDVLKQSGGEEYAIHDVEYIPSSMYSEYMGRNDFQALYDVMETAKRNDLPLEVVQDIVSQYGEGGVEEFVGKYDSAVDFAEELVDEMGIESFNDFEYYLDVSETDRRLLAQEMADSYADDIRDEDGGNRLIMEAGMNVDDYEEADSGMQEEMLDNAREVVYDEYYDTWYDGLKDPYYFLVEEQGLYNAEDFAKQNFVRVDYDKLADALEQDYTFVQHDGNVYVFNIR
jgi:antirestriction protein